MALRWIQSDGGPLVVLARAHRVAWEGSDPPSGGRVVRATFRFDDAAAPATDYDAAVDAAFGVVKRDGWNALALPRGPKTWRRLRDGIVLVAWEHGPSRPHVDRLLVAAFPDRPRDDHPVKWKRTRLRLRVDGRELLAFDAASGGARATAAKSLAIPIAAGTYAIDVAELAPGPETLLSLYRLRR